MGLALLYRVVERGEMKADSLAEKMNELITERETVTTQWNPA